MSATKTSQMVGLLLGSIVYNWSVYWTWEFSIANFEITRGYMGWIRQNTFFQFSRSSYLQIDLFSGHQCLLFEVHNSCDVCGLPRLPQQTGTITGSNPSIRASILEASGGQDVCLVFNKV
jgi:hypothetical protein